MVKENIKIVIGMFNAPAMKGMKQLRGGLNLLSSAFRAVFRTTIVAGLFLALRQVFLAIQNIKNAITSVIPELMKMNQAATLTAAVMSKGGSSFQKNFEGAAQIAREAAAAIGKSATDIQSGLFIAGISGFNLADAMKLTEQSMKLAAVSGMNFKQVMNDLIGISRGFRVSMSDVPALAETLAGAFTKVKMELADAFQGLKRVSAIAVTAFGPGQETINDMAAALMTMNDVGVEASRAATYLRSGITRLLSPTNKVTTAFSKYGINIFKADEKNQRFLSTLLKGQSAMGSYYEKLNQLKKRQFDLVLSGQSSSKAFEEVNEQLAEVNKQMGLLDSGVSDVYKQFTMAGGKLKPFNELLDELIEKKIPAEVVAGMFGVRTGQMITTMLANPEKFKENRRYLIEINAEYERGASILKDMYSRVLDTILTKWARLKTTMVSIWSAVFDAAAPTMGKLFDSVLEGMTAFYQSVESNKGLFRELFEGVGELIQESFGFFKKGLEELAGAMEKVLTVGSELSLPIFEYQAGKKGTAGEIIRTEKTVEYGGSITERLKLFFQSLSSLILSSFKLAMGQLQPVMDVLGKSFVDAIALQLQGQMALFKTIGGWIAEGVLAGLVGLGGKVASAVTPIGQAKAVWDAWRQGEDKKKGGLDTEGNGITTTQEKKSFFDGILNLFKDPVDYAIMDENLAYMKENMGNFGTVIEKSLENAQALNTNIEGFDQVNINFGELINQEQQNTQTLNRYGVASISNREAATDTMSNMINRINRNSRRIMQLNSK